MPLFRKKPITIEARQFTKETQAQVAAWCDACGGYVVLGGGATDSPWMEVSTAEGRMRATYGDWIIRGVKGELYPCKPDIFEVTYEPVQSEAEGTGE